MPSAPGGVGGSDCEGDAVIGFQAQCEGCEWASIVHLDRNHAAEDAELHERYFRHMGTIATVESVDQIRPVGRA